MRQSPRRRLPLQPGPLFGRDLLLREACALLTLGGVRLLTLTGPAGAGKTRLSLAVAERLTGGVGGAGGEADGGDDRGGAGGAGGAGDTGETGGLGEAFGDGVVFVDLAPLRDPAQFVPAVAGALGIGEAGGQGLFEAVRRAVGERRVLMLLDNCEHLLGAAPVAGELLEACPGLSMLATSRSPLHLRWEHELAVPPLTTPDLRALPGVAELAATPAVALFVARAQAVRHDFALSAENAATVAHICVRLDGLPLALELAAARTRVLDLETLRVRLERRLHLLTGGGRDRPTRHQTLRAAIGSSYDLLAPAERALFRRLAVFSGGAGLEGATAVCAGPDLPESEVLDRLEALAAGSLVRVETPSGRGEARYAMLETVREYAAERLAESGEAPERRRRHTWYCLTLAERAGAALRGPQQGAWLARLDALHDDLRAVLGRALPSPSSESEAPAVGVPFPDGPAGDWGARDGRDGRDERVAAADAAVGLRLAAALAPFWALRGHLSEGHRWLQRLLDGAAASGASAPAAAHAGALLGAGLLARQRTDWEQARARLTAGLELARRDGETRLAGQTAIALGQVLLDRGDLAAAAPLLEEGIARLEAAGATADLVDARRARANLAESRSDLRTARESTEGALALARASGDRNAQAAILYDLGRLVVLGGDAARARALFAEGLVLAGEIGSPRQAAKLHRWLGELLCNAGDLEGAGGHLRASLDLAREMDDTMGTVYALAALGDVTLRAGDPARAQALLEESLARAEGARHPWGRSRALRGLTAAAVAAGDHGRALALLHQEILLVRELDDHLGVAYALERLADLLATRNTPAPAARLRQAGVVLRRAAGGRLPATAHDALPERDGGAQAAQAAQAEQAEIEGAVAEALALTAPDASGRGRNAAPLRRPFDLTEREAEVLTLLVRGASDAEIARRLVISVRTANRHVANILSKTGAPNRTAAAAIALGRSLAVN